MTVFQQEEYFKEKISEIGIQVRGWEADTTHPDKERILNDIIQEFFFFKCKLALINPEYMKQKNLNKKYCLDYIFKFDFMKQEKIKQMKDISEFKQK